MSGVHVNIVSIFFHCIFITNTSIIDALVDLAYVSVTYGRPTVRIFGKAYTEDTRVFPEFSQSSFSVFQSIGLLVLITSLCHQNVAGAAAIKVLIKENQIKLFRFSL